MVSNPFRVKSKPRPLDGASLRLSDLSGEIGGPPQRRCAAKSIGLTKNTVLRLVKYRICLMDASPPFLVTGDRNRGSMHRFVSGKNDHPWTRPKKEALRTDDPFGHRYGLEIR